MAYLADFTQLLIDGLTAEGLPCCREYESTNIMAYENRLFATAALEQLRLDPPIVMPEGTAFPLALQMRVRFFALPEQSTADLESLLDSYLIPALNRAEMQLRGLTAEAIAIDKGIGRMCMTTHITVAAVATHLHVQEDASESEEAETDGV